MEAFKMEIKTKDFLVEIDSVNNIYTIKSGSVLKERRPSFSSALAELRDSSCSKDSTGVETTTTDVVFKSLSSLASFIQGASTNGKQYFNRWLGTKTTASSKEEKVETPVETPVEKTEDSSKEETPKPKATCYSDLSKEEKQERKNLYNDIISFFKDIDYKPDILIVRYCFVKS